jgi:hypothetical protein
MNAGFFAFIWTNIAQRIQTATGQVINALLAWVGAPFQLCVVAYLIIILMIAAWSSDETAFQRFFRQIWLAAVIYTLASNATAFDYYVRGLVNGVTTSITTAIAGIFGGNGSITANSFDNISVKMFAAGLQVMKQLSWSAPTARTSCHCLLADISGSDICHFSGVCFQHDCDELPCRVRPAVYRDAFLCDNADAL